MNTHTQGYVIAGESVSDEVGREFGRLIAERDRLQQQVIAANLLAEQTSPAVSSPAPSARPPEPGETT